MTKTHLAVALAFLAFAPMTASAETQEEQQACMNDAFNICAAEIPDRDRVAACLFRNMKRVSFACRTVMARYQKQPLARAKYTRD